MTRARRAGVSLMRYGSSLSERLSKRLANPKIQMLRVGLTDRPTSVKTFNYRGRTIAGHPSRFSSSTLPLLLKVGGAAITNTAMSSLVTPLS